MRLIMFLARMTPNCKECCRYASEDLEVSHSAWMRFKIWVHFKICHACEIYAKQLRHLHENLSRDAEEFRTEECLSEEARERIRAELRAQSGG
jgi:hypothetical protein